jgi:hypothetical protein
MPTVVLAVRSIAVEDMAADPTAEALVRLPTPYMHGAIELANLRRSILLLPPGSMAMTREDAVALIAELQETGRRLRALRDALRQVMPESEE